MGRKEAAKWTAGGSLPRIRGEGEATSGKARSPSSALVPTFFGGSPTEKDQWPFAPFFPYQNRYRKSGSLALTSLLDPGYDLRGHRGRIPEALLGQEPRQALRASESSAAVFFKGETPCQVPLILFYGGLNNHPRTQVRFEKWEVGKDCSHRCPF